MTSCQEKISHKISKILNDPKSTKFISVISFWEISLKFSLEKIDLVGISPDELPDIAKKANFDIIDLDAETASFYHKLPKTNNELPRSKAARYPAESSYVNHSSAQQADAVFWFNNKDPFDRMLAWQAIRKDCVLITRDRVFSGYKNGD